MEAIDVFFSGTPQQFAVTVNSLVGSRLLPETGKIIFDVKREEPDSVLIEVQTPEDIEHARGVTMRGAYIAEIEAHTAPTGTCVTLRPGLYREYDPVALRWWEALLDRLRFEGWRVWTTGEPAQAEQVEDAPKTTAAADCAREDLLDALAERIAPIIIVGNGNVVGDGSSSRVLQGTLAAPVETASRSTGSAGNTAPIHDQLNTRRRKLLQEKLENHFNENELRSLCFDLGVDYENLGGEGKVGKARELIGHQERRGDIDGLIDRCRELRPKISWEDTFGISPIVASE
jgi:hypothetical protein